MVVAPRPPQVAPMQVILQFFLKIELSPAFWQGDQIVTFVVVTLKMCIWLGASLKSWHSGRGSRS